jgi:peptidoglycan/LPS O-acetylase OafA/YrhL
VTGSGPSRLGHVSALNGLRGLAIAAVVVFHVFAGHGDVDSGGFLGVDLFFVLSGFLITTLLLEEQDVTGHIDLKAFWLRRARRLLPAAGSVILLVMLLAAAAHDFGRAATIVSGEALYAGNIVRSVDPHLPPGPVDHFWSLGEEEQFYVLWPAVLILALRRLPERRLLRFLFAAAVSIAAYRIALGMSGASVHRLYFAPDTHADGLVLGCAAAAYRRLGLRLPGVGLAFLALAGVLAAFMFAYQDIHGLLFVLPAFNVAAAILVLAASTPGAAASIFAVRPLAYLGVISYSVYVWHQLVRQLLGDQHPSIALLSILVVAVGSYHLIERPFRYGRSASSLPGESPPLAAPDGVQPAS